MQSYTLPTVIVPIVNLNDGALGTVQASDVYPAVDVTDVTQSPQGTTKPYQIASLMAFMLGSFGFTVYSPVLAATTANLVSTYTPGTIIVSPGVGATLTNSGALSAFTVDGKLGVLNGDYLVKNQLLPAQNGIYTLTTVGDNISIPWVLTRKSNFNQTSNIVNNSLIYVLYGTSQQSTIWQDSFTTPLTVGTTSINWNVWNLLFAGSGTVSVGVINQLAYYASGGSTVSGLPIVNNSALLTSNTGVPSFTPYTGTGAPMLNTSPKIINGFLDTNGNSIIGVNPATNAVNYVTFTNGAAGANAVINAAGSDANIILALLGQGKGGVAIQGKTSGVSYNSGYVGEIISSTITFLLPTAYTSGSTVNITSIALTAGDWIIYGNIGLSGTTVTSLQGGISTTTGVLPVAENSINIGTVSATTLNYTVPSFRLNISVPQTIYLVVSGTGTGSMIMFGNLIARRQ